MRPWRCPLDACGWMDQLTALRALAAAVGRAGGVEHLTHDKTRFYLAAAPRDSRQDL
jgi:hypothetical protein